MVFADVRGSTAIGEQIGPSAFHRLIDRFYREGIRVFVESGALIEKLIGDEIAALYTPGIAGADHPALALEAARQLLVATGHDGGEEPWIPVGVGVHSGTVYAGAVGAAGQLSVITVLGDAANVTARLAASAATGEILISEQAYCRVGEATGEEEKRHLEVRGRDDPLEVVSLRLDMD